MQDNRIFHFIKATHQSGYTEKNTEVTAFLMHELAVAQPPLTMKTQIAGKDVVLRLDSQHLSFYECYDVSNAALSEYHLTAYFIGNNGKKYQLHVFLNGRDQLTTQPQLSQLQADLTYLRISKPMPDLFNQEAVAHAIESLGPIVRALRVSYQQKIKADAERFAAMEKELSLLSMNVTENQKGYIAKIEESMAFLDTIHRYHPNNAYYRSVCSLLDRIKGSVARNHSKLPQKAHKENKASSDALSSFDATAKKGPYPTSTMTQDNVPKQSLSLADLIQKAQIAFKTFQSSNHNVDLLLKSYTLAQEANLLSVGFGYDLSLAELEAIRALMQSNQQSRQRLLELLLLNNKFPEDFPDTAALIGHPDNHDVSALTPTLAARLFMHALHSGNAKLLDCLLTYSPIPINTFPTEGNLSPVMYCYLKDSPTKPKAGCLSILIKHGASLMELDPVKKLPLAHIILDEPFHPLRKALLAEKNQKLTVANVSFYNSLIRMLDTRSSGSSHQDIAASLERYRMSLRFLRSDNSSIAHKANQRLMDKSAQLEQKMLDHNILSQETIIKLLFDSEIQQKMMLFCKLNIAYKKLLNTREKNMAAKGTEEVIGAFDDLVGFCSEMEFDEVKACCSEALDKQIRMVRNSIDLLDIKEQLERCRDKKEFRKLKKKQNELMAPNNIGIEETRPKGLTELPKPLKAHQQKTVEFFNKVGTKYNNAIYLKYAEEVKRDPLLSLEDFYERLFLEAMTEVMYEENMSIQDFERLMRLDNTDEEKKILLAKTKRRLEMNHPNPVPSSPVCTSDTFFKPNNELKESPPVESSGHLLPLEEVAPASAIAQEETPRFLS